MATGLDRGLEPQRIQPYVSSNRKYFERLHYLDADDSHFFECVDNITPDTWEMRQKGTWTYVIHPSKELPSQGFKIHLSTTPKLSEKSLRLACSTCVDFGASFKFLNNLSILELSVSKNFYRGAAGKFITVYPKCREEFELLSELLYKKFLELSGPYILSDRNYKNSCSVFYRYGGIKPNQEINIYGEKDKFILDPSGKKARDRRLPYFILPGWVENPFGRGPVDVSSEVTLKNRYKVEGSFKLGNAGGVYLAEDGETNEEVIIKGARPFISRTRTSDFDAVDRLKREYAVLEQLADIPQVVSALDFFEVGRHSYLVEKKARGEVFAKFRTDSAKSPALDRNFDHKRKKHFCEVFDRISENLLDAVSSVHNSGIVIGDLSAGNVLVDPDSLEVTLIDFGSAVEAGRKVKTQEMQFTPGFFPPDRRPDEIDGYIEAQFADDYYAVGVLLYCMICPIEPYLELNPEARWVSLKRFASQLDLPKYVSAVVKSLMQEGSPDRARRLLAGSRSDADSYVFAHSASDEASEPKYKYRMSCTDSVTSLTNGILRHLDANADFSRKDRLWPADYRVFSTNPLSVAYGAAGPSLFINRVRGNLSSDVLQWLLQHDTSLDDYAPGLYVGLSGVAWAFDLLGLSDRAESTVQSIHASSLLGQSPDIFYGDSGIGLTYLHFWTAMRKRKYLEKAKDLGDSLVERSVQREEGITWRNSDEKVHIGYAHGGSGVAHFLLELYVATGDDRYLKAAKSALDHDLARAFYNSADDSLSWPYEEGGTTQYPYWRYGSAGIGSVLIRFYSHLGDDKYLRYAEKAARRTMQKFTVYPGLFDGMSGLGEFLIDMYRATSEEAYMDAAWDLQGIAAYAAERDGGVVFPGEHLIRYTTDYATGSAGIGMFLHRLLNPDTKRLFHDLRPVSECESVQY